MRGRSHLYFRVLFPVAPDRPNAHVGAWKVWLRNDSGRRADSNDLTHGFGGGVPMVYSVMAKARSDFRLAGQVEQTTNTPGSVMEIILEPTLYGQPVTLSEPVDVEIARPDETIRRLRLARDPSCVYRGTYEDTGQLGPYRIAADVSAHTGAGAYITRHRQMTGLIFRPGSGTGGNGGPDIGDLIDVFEKCCKRQLAGQQEMIKILRELIKKQG